MYLPLPADRLLGIGPPPRRLRPSPRRGWIVLGALPTDGSARPIVAYGWIARDGVHVGGGVIEQDAVALLELAGVRGELEPLTELA